MLVLTPISCIRHVTYVLGWRPSGARASMERVLGHARLGRPRAGGRYFGWPDTLVGSIALRAAERGFDKFPSVLDPSIYNDTATLA